jgi:RNA polymerase sigma factor (sigma-70 family)
LAGLDSSDALVSTSIEQLPDNVKQLTQFNSPRTNTLPSNESNAERPVLDDVVEKWFSVLSFRERTVLEHLYLITHQFSIGAIGRIISVPKQKAEQIHQAALAKLVEAASLDPPLLELIEFVHNADRPNADPQIEIELSSQFRIHKIDPLSVIQLVSVLPISVKTTISKDVNVSTSDYEMSAANYPKDVSHGKPFEASRHAYPWEANLAAWTTCNASIEIEVLDLSLRSYNALRRAGIDTVAQVVSLLPNHIWNVKNIGQKTVEEIRKQVHQYISNNPIPPESQETQFDENIQVVSKTTSLIQEPHTNQEPSGKQPSPLINDKTPIQELSFTRRTLNLLLRAGIKTIGQLVVLSYEQLLEIRGAGEKTLQEVENRLSAYSTEFVPYSQRDREESLYNSAVSASLHDIAVSKQSDFEQHTTPMPLSFILKSSLLEELSTAPLGKIGIARLGLSKREVRTLQNSGIDSIRELIEGPQKLSQYGNIVLQLRRYLQWLSEQNETIWLEEAAGMGISPLHQSDLAATTLEALFDQWLNTLTNRAKRILSWRFGLEEEHLTLQEIGERIDVTRERVRQIEKKALRTLQDRFGHWKNKQLLPFLTFLHQLFLDHGGLLSQSEIIELLEREDVVRLGNINPLGAFLLICEIDEQFSFYKSEEFAALSTYSFAALSTYSVDTISQVQGRYKDILSKRLTGISRLTLLKDFRKSSVYQELESILPEEFFQACLRVHPEIERLKSGLYSLSKASSKRLGAIVTAMRELGEPAHYSVIAEKTNALLPAEEQFTERALHAKLGQHPDVFVWTRLRGTYGLKEWGLEQGLSYVDAIEKILLEENRPLTFEQVIQRLPKYREFFDEGSVIITLGTHEKFKSFSNNTYGLSHWNTSKSEFDFGDMFGEKLAQRQLELDRRNSNADIDTQSEVEKIRRVGLDFFAS